MVDSRTLQHLAHVHPALIMVVARALQYTNVDFIVTEGLRSLPRQYELVNLGFSKTMDSKHVKQGDGMAHAVDVMAVGDLNLDGQVDHQDKSITWSPEWYTEIANAMQAAADELGVKIRWGGSFKSFFDGPHFELING